jgi:hypothetical protein
MAFPPSIVQPVADLWRDGAPRPLAPRSAALQSLQSSPTLGNMTVGIAAIGHRGKAVVVGADRMMSYGAPVWLEFDAHARKIARLTNHALVLSTGTASETIAIRKRVLIGEAPLGALPISQIADKVKEAREDLRSEYAEKVYLRRAITGMTSEEFRKAASTGNSQILTDAYTKMGQLSFAIAFLICGIDADGAHIYTVDENVQTSSFLDIGFVAIGSGTFHATASLARSEHKKSASLPETIYRVYEAKKAAEMAAGVGKTTDIGVVVPGRRPFFLPSAKVNKLEEIYRKMKPRKLSRLDLTTINSMVED